MGLSPLMTQEVFKVLKTLKQQGTTIFLIEQNAYEALELTDRAYIMESGRITLEGRSSELLNDDRVKNAYLGGDV
jgi:branched-chain amino acid transport system ATP-binding protein